MESAAQTLNSMWQIFGVSVTGTSHQKNGHGCDDAHSYRQLPDGTLLIAVADGAGSSPRSAEGAAYAVWVALNAAQAELVQQLEPVSAEQWHELLGTVVATVRAALEELATGSIMFPGNEAQEMQRHPASPLRDFATTLLLTVVTSQWITTAQIGDGAVVVQYADGTLQALTRPDHGEYINETSFMTEHDYINRVQYKALRIDIQGIALLTDGLQMLALDVVTNTPYEPFFAPLFRFAAKDGVTVGELKAFLESERVCARTDDDKTLVLAVR